MKVFLTLQFVALLCLCVAWWRDASKRTDYRSLDGGWTTTYTVDSKVRQEAYHLSYFAGLLSIIGFLVLIWTF